MRIDIVPGIAIDDSEIAISFIQSGGPGGQNVNKVATAAQLRFDARHSLSLSNAVKVRLQALAGSRLTREGVIVITAREFRSQDRNRQEAIERLVELIAQAARVPVKRRPTRASFGERQRRLQAKGHRAEIKRNRGFRPDD
jgi:ribosome-associated protein